MKGRSALRQKDLIDDGPYAVYGASGIIGSMSTFQNGARYVAVVKDGAGVGRVNLCSARTSVLGTMQALIPTEMVLPEYLLHLIRAMRLGDGFSGSTIPHIYFKDYGQRLVRYVSMADQERIVGTLGSIEDQIDILHQQNERLDTLVKSRFVEMFGDTEYPLVVASEIMGSFRNGISPSKTGGVHSRILTLSAVTQGKFDSSAWKDGAFKEEPSADKRVSDRDFYICRGNGNKDLVGTAVFADHDYPDLVFPDTMIAGVIDDAKINRVYLSSAWAQPAVRSQIESKVRTTNGTFKINQEIVASLQIPLPPLALQQEFASFVAEVDKSRFNLLKAYGSIIALFRVLFPEYRMRTP